jgi:hypothetical protein
VCVHAVLHAVPIRRETDKKGVYSFSFEQNKRDRLYRREPKKKQALILFCCIKAFILSLRISLRRYLPNIANFLPHSFNSLLFVVFNTAVLYYRSPEVGCLLDSSNSVKSEILTFPEVVLPAAAAVPVAPEVFNSVCKSSIVTRPCAPPA